MKRSLSLLLLLALLSACASGQKELLDLDTLDAAAFARQMEEIFADTRPYVGRQVRLTGTYAAQTLDGTQYCYIYRSEADGTLLGFELDWDGAAPQEGEEICVEGTLETYEQDGLRYLSLRAQSLQTAAEPYAVSEACFLADLAMLYETPAAYEGAPVTITGAFAAETFSGRSWYRVEREAQYLDGTVGKVGLEFTWQGELPAVGDWITVCGILHSYEFDGQTWLTLEATQVEPASGGSRTVYETE